MREFKKLKYVQKVLVFFLAFCIVFVSSSPDAMAKSKKALAVKSISLKIGKKCDLLEYLSQRDVINAVFCDGVR